MNYQLNSQQTLYFGGLARLDFITGERTSLVCYFHRRLQIHRTKLEKADELYNRHMTLKPEPKEKRNIQSYRSKNTRKCWCLYKRSINIKEIRNVNRKTKKIFKT